MLCNIWGIISLTRDQTCPPVLEAQSFNYWTTREAPDKFLINVWTLLFWVNLLVEKNVGGALFGCILLCVNCEKPDYRITHKLCYNVWRNKLWPSVFICVENVSWKGLPQTVTLFILGQQDSRYFHLIHYPLLYYLYFAQWAGFIFMNKDTFKSLKPTWGESQSLSPSRQAQPLGLAAGCLRPGSSPWTPGQPSAQPRRQQRVPTSQGAPWLGVPRAGAVLPVRFCPPSASWWGASLSVWASPAPVLRVEFRSLSTRADRSCFSFSIVSETNCRWPVTR